MADLTRILNALPRGESASDGDLLQAVYDELRDLARIRMAHEAPGHTLQATALVHEAWLRLQAASPRAWENRAHFFAAAGEAMRRILVDHARRKHSQKRGGNLERVDLEETRLVLAAPAEEVLAVHEALDRLAAEDAAAAELVKLRYFAGLTMEDAASVLQFSKRSAEGLWTYARAWLRREIRDPR